MQQQRSRSAASPTQVSTTSTAHSTCTHPGGTHGIRMDVLSGMEEKRDSQFVELAVNESETSKKMPLVSSVLLLSSASASTVPECNFAWRPFLELQNAHAVHFRSASEYDRYEGVGLGGVMHLGDLTSFPAANATTLSDLLPEARVWIGSCVVSTGQQAAWHRQRIGPFRSTGGFDFWQFGWSDVGELQAVVEANAGRWRVGVNAYRSAAFDDVNGAPLGFPPMHMHHVHIMPSPHTYESWKSGIECMLWGEDCTDISPMILQHGDAQCTSREGGTNCFEVDHAGHPTLVRGTLSSLVEINDARPQASPPLAWWYEISMRVARTTAEDVPLSLLLTSNSFGTSAKQTDSFGLIRVPSHVDSFNFYTGQMPFAGALTFTRYHAHHAAFQKAFLFSATTQQLGLDRGPLWMPVTYHSVITSSVGVANNSALEAHLLSRLSEPVGQTGRAAAAVARVEPRLVCTATGSLERVGSRWYDRVPAVSCDAWVFQQDEVFTAVQLNGPVAATAGEHTFAGMGKTEARATYDFPQHDAWFMYYSAADGESHYMETYYSQALEATPPYGVMTRMILRTFLTGYTPQAACGVWERTEIAVVLFVLWFGGAPPAGAHPALRAGLVCVAVVLAGAVQHLGWPMRCSYPRLARQAALAACTAALELYVFALAFYVTLPASAYLNPLDRALMLARPGFAQERVRAAAQLAASLVAIGVFAAAVAWRTSSIEAHESERRVGQKHVLI